MAKFAVIVVLCILGATLSKAAVDKEALIKDFMGKVDECTATAGATKADIDELIKRQPASSMEGKCLRACIFKKYKMMDDNGKMVPAVALEHAKYLTDGDAGKMKMATEMIDACAGIAVPADHCEAAEAYGKCMKEQAIAHGMTEGCEFFN